MSADPYRYFRLESRELIDQLTRAALELEHAPEPAQLVDVLLRLVHTLKGAARVVKQHAIADEAHAIEDLLAPLRGASRIVDSSELVRLFASLDAIREHVQDIERPAAEPKSAAIAVPASAPVQAGAPEPTEHVVQPGRIHGEELDQLREHLSDTYVAAVSLDEQQAALLKARQLTGRVHESLRRLNLSDRELEGAVEELSELVDASYRALDGVAHKLRSDLAEARESAARLQFVAAGSLFAPLEMAARDAAQMAGKLVRVSCEGADIHLAADVIGVLQAALIQAVRNAVAHGIETREERVSRGKNAMGLIRIKIERAGAKIVCRCADDGAGVDLAALREALGADESASLSKEELLKRLLRGGISTSKDVTQLSGRGVGLGILREAAAKLRGELALSSEPGAGTDIELRVPMSSAMLDALIVSQDKHCIAIPLHAVKHTRRITAKDLVVDARGQGLVHDGGIVPFAAMGRMLRQSTVAPARDDAWSAILIEAAGGIAAVGVDRLQGVANVVVKPLPPCTPADAMIAAAYLDPEGFPQLVLDPEKVVEFVKTAVQPPANDEREQLPLLVVDDSLTTRMLEQGILESAGYEVELAVSGEDGLARARARPHALFLVDVEMPGINGFEFIEQIRADADLRDTPALLVSSLGSSVHRERGMRAGADGYIDKGQFEQKEFLGMVRRLVQRQ